MWRSGTHECVTGLKAFENFLTAFSATFLEQKCRSAHFTTLGNHQAAQYLVCITYFLTRSDLAGKQKTTQRERVTSVRARERESSKTRKRLFF